MLDARTALRAAVYYGEGDCEHQELSQSPIIIHGSGQDAGSVVIQIGNACISFSSAAALVAALVKPDPQLRSIPLVG